MKKLLTILILTICFLLPIWVYWACGIWVDEVKNIWDSLDECLSWSPLVDWSNAKIDEWLQTRINSWVKNIWSVLWVLAVWAIVYWSLQMTLSWWEDEKVKKSKDIVKWWILWFLWVIFASSIIVLIINIMYSLSA